MIDIILYFKENPLDWIAIAVLFVIVLVFEVFSEIVAELVARPGINMIKGWFRAKIHPKD
ncbi:hypothetical protein LCGC14_1339570 [marine sediment metagenome]|uniref:CNNM transmembrane domain-containing protein n=1 Tax=marine sediment metagenome TaxID=412755 RepID=A0A0F9KEU8_9ZZZZ